MRNFIKIFYERGSLGSFLELGELGKSLLLLRYLPLLLCSSAPLLLWPD